MVCGKKIRLGVDSARGAGKNEFQCACHEHEAPNEETTTEETGLIRIPGEESRKRERAERETLVPLFPLRRPPSLRLFCLSALRAEKQKSEPGSGSLSRKRILTERSAQLFAPAGAAS